VRVEFCEADILDAFDEWRRAIGGLPVEASRPLSARPRAGAAASGNRSAADEGGAAGAGAATATGAGVGAKAGAGAGDATGPDTTGAGATGHAAGEDDGGGGGAEAGGSHGRRKTGLQTHIDRVMARLTQRRVDVGTNSALGGVIDRLLSELDTLRAGARGARNETRAALVDRLTSLDRDLIEAARAALDAPALSELQADARRELDPFRSRMPAEAWQTATDAALVRLIRDRWRLPSVHADD
jgi:hypothetical protein